MNNLTLNTEEEIEKLAVEWLRVKYPTATNNEMKQFLMFCKVYKLNPWKNEAYFISYKGKLQLVTNYVVLVARAKTNPKYYREEIEYYQNGKRLIGVKLSPEMKNLIIIVNIYDSVGNRISNYDFDVDSARKNINGSFETTQFHSWAQKNAIVNAFRRTFPGELQGLYIAEEFVANEPQNKMVIENNKPNNKFINLKEYLEERYETNEERKEALEKYLNKNNLKLQDLVDGNFDMDDFIKDNNTDEGEEIENA